MKNLISCLMLIMLFATACSKDQTPSIELGSGIEQEIVLEPDGSSKIVKFKSSQAWHVEYSDDASWLELSPLEGEAGTGRVKVEARGNISGEVRRAEFTVCSGTQSVQFSVVQDVFDLIFEVDETEMHISASGDIISIPINSNQDFTVVSDQAWLVPLTSQAARPEYIIVGIEPNHTQAARTSELVLSGKVADLTITVTQDAADGLSSQWTEKSFASRSLAMRFTATWCGYCPQMATALDLAKEQMNGALELVSLHGEESKYEFAGTSHFVRRFKVDGYPTGVIDSRASIPNYSASIVSTAAQQVAQETKESYPTVSGIAVDSYVSGDELIVFVPIYFHQAGSYHVTVLLLEDGIVGYQNGKGNNYTHNDVARASITSISGESVRVESANTVCSQIYTTKLESNWNPDNLKVLVFVEKPYGDQPMVEEVRYAEYGNYGDTYIDNCRVVKVGEKAAVELM